MEVAERFEGFIEDDVVRPLLRGNGVDAWRFEISQHLIWLHDDETAKPRNAPNRTARFLARHETALRARSGWRPTIPVGSVFRTNPSTTRPKVAWQDLADDLKAVAVPARIRAKTGRELPVIPLNTVYFIPTASHDDALRLAALLNSLPVRTFARTIAERAKDARFRFQGWTLGLLPIPDRWADGRTAAELLGISRRAHEAGGLSDADSGRLDTLVGRIYGLTTDDLDSMNDFDRWLRGEQ